MDRHGETGGIFGVVLIVRADWQDWTRDGGWARIWQDWDKRGGLEFDEEA